MRPVNRLKVGMFASVALLAMMNVWLSSHPALAAPIEPPREKQDCHVYETKTNKVTVAMTIAGLSFSLPYGIMDGPSGSVRPETTFERTNGVEWEKAVHGVIARYVELCTRYNAGLVTREEYNARMDEIQGVYQDMKGLEGRTLKETKERAQAAYGDLDRALSGRSPQKPKEEESTSAAWQALNRRIERLESGGQTPTAKP
jgi:hypothetical protein